jgi:hypothetical protein
VIKQHFRGTKKKYLGGENEKKTKEERDRKVRNKI